MRKLVSMRKIVSISLIEGADRIECIQIDGWQIVAQKGLHSVGDDVLYFEIDSFLPQSDARYESFMKFGTRTFDGVLGHKVKTVRLKGVYSQGIIMPLKEFPEIVDPQFDVDYSELLGIVKWEFFEGTGYQGDAKGNFPRFIRKTDQERIQNLYGKLSQTHADKEFVGTLKLDGMSCTVFYVNGDKYNNQGLGICSRNLELKMPDVTEESFDFKSEGKFYQGATNSDLFAKVIDLNLMFGSYYAIQGELVGAGIQGNFEKFDKYQVFAYNIFDIEKQEYVDYKTFKAMCEEVGIEICPEIYPAQKVLQKPIKEILEMADGKGLKASYREGICWKELDGTCQFKVISNFYLTGEE